MYVFGGYVPIYKGIGGLLGGVDPHIAERAEVLDMDGFLHLVALYNMYTTLGLARTKIGRPRKVKTIIRRQAIVRYNERY